QAHVLAHDYGDTVAQELLARHNDRQANGGAGVELLSMCLLNGGLFPETHRARLVQKLLNSPLGVILVRLMNKRSFEQSFSAVFGPQTQPSQDELDAFWQLVSREGGVRI
ncbi:MAG: alpha/beta hydrolase, partial [Nevskiales bacterium]